MNSQRIKVGVAALMEKVDAKIKEREAQLLAQSMSYVVDRQKWFDAADAALNIALHGIEEGREPEDVRYGKRGDSIVVEVGRSFPEEPDTEHDSQLGKMRRHRALLEMAADTTINIDPEGEYGRYL